MQEIPGKDLDGNQRPLDGDEDNTATMDMGVYEYNPDAPTIAVGVEEIDFYATIGGDNPIPQTLWIRNCGGETLNWEITGQDDWLTVTPDTGTSDGELVQVSLNANIAGLTRKTHYKTLTIADPAAVNLSRKVRVRLHLGKGTIHVPGEYSSIQTAFGRAIPGETVVVAPGTYYERLDLYPKRVTLRSSDGPATTIIDGESAVGHVILCENGVDTDTVIDGFTIANGYWPYSDWGQGGGGMYNLRSSPTVRNCVFRGNHATYSGGGIANTFNSHPTLLNCTFEGNSARSGAGLHNDIGCSPIVRDCVFRNNNASSAGGGIYNFSFSGAKIHNCRFLGNRADFGGAMYNGSSKANIFGCEFTGNTANEDGGAIAGYGGEQRISNCTFVANSAGVDAGTILSSSNSNAVLNNCIIWDSYSPTGNHIYDNESTTVVTHSVVQDGWLGDSNIDTDPVFVANPDDGGDGWGDDPETAGVDESLNDDFGDLRLQAGSPCIDAGKNDAVPADVFDLDGDGDITEPVPFDLQGLLRFLDDPATDDTGVGVAPIVDIGAYEYHSALVLGDCDSDGDLDRDDLRKLAKCTGGVNNDVIESCSCCDMDGDSDVDLVDYSFFQQNMTVPEFGDGDCDVDGDVDSGDLQTFVGCLSVPGIAAEEGCLCSDLDGDGDVDLDDYRHLQRIVTDPFAGSADLDRDGDVDLVDFGLLQSAFGGLAGSSADLDDDGYVDLDDYLLLNQQFGGPQ